MRFNILSLGLIATAFIASISAQPIGNPNQALQQPGQPGQAKQKTPPPPKEEEEKEDGLVPGLGGVTEITRGIPMSSLTSAAGGLTSGGLTGEGLTGGLLGKGGASGLTGGVTNLDAVSGLLGGAGSLDAAKGITDAAGGLTGGKLVRRQPGGAVPVSAIISEVTNTGSGTQTIPISSLNHVTGGVVDNIGSGSQRFVLSSFSGFPSDDASIDPNLSAVIYSIGGSRDLITDTVSSTLRRRQTTTSQGLAEVDEEEEDENEVTGNEEEVDENEVTPNENEADENEADEDGPAGITRRSEEEEEEEQEEEEQEEEEQEEEEQEEGEEEYSKIARRSTVGDIEQELGA